MKEERLTIEDLRRIANEIFEQEKKENNITGDFIPLTYVEYYCDHILKKKYILKEKIELAKLYKHATGFNAKGTIVIFLDKFNNAKKIEKNIFYLAKTCYHEIRHTIQYDFDVHSYDDFLYRIETFIKQEYNQDYRLNHDLYSFEIGANLYGVRKAKEYLKKNYPYLYEEQKEEIDRLERQYTFDYITFDAANTFERFLQHAKEYRKKNISEIAKQRKIKENEVDFLFLHLITPVLTVFLTNELNFKSIDKIINHQEFNNLDKRIIYAIFSSKSFLEQLNIEELSIEELELVNESLQYTSILYQKQSILLQEKFNNNKISYLKYLKAQKSLIKKLLIIDNYNCRIDKLNKLNYNRNFDKQKMHMESIQDYIEKINEQLEQKKK